MMIITGHTSGLGKALLSRYPEAIGLSRTNGFDINRPEEIVKKAVGADIFINNAYSGFAQTELLYALIRSGFKGHIINISSNSGDGIKKKPHDYAIHKSSLDKANEQLYYVGHNVTSVRPGWIDTPRVRHVSEEKMSASSVVDVIKFVIDADHRIKEITFTL